MIIVAVAYARIQDFSERGMLKVRPHTKSGGGGGGRSPLQVRYTKSVFWGGGGGSPLQVRYLCLPHICDYCSRGRGTD